MTILQSLLSVNLTTERVSTSSVVCYHRRKNIILCLGDINTVTDSNVSQSRPQTNNLIISDNTTEFSPLAATSNSLAWNGASGYQFTFHMYQLRQIYDNIEYSYVREIQFQGGYIYGVVSLESHDAFAILIHDDNIIHLVFIDIDGNIVNKCELRGLSRVECFEYDQYRKEFLISLNNGRIYSFSMRYVQLLNNINSREYQCIYRREINLPSYAIQIASCDLVGLCLVLTIDGSIHCIDTGTLDEIYHISNNKFPYQPIRIWADKFGCDFLVQCVNKEDDSQTIEFWSTPTNKLHCPTGKFERISITMINLIRNACIETVHKPTKQLFVTIMTDKGIELWRPNAANHYNEIVLEGSLAHLHASSNSFKTSHILSRDMKHVIDGGLLLFLGGMRSCEISLLSGLANGIEVVSIHTNTIEYNDMIPLNRMKPYERSSQDIQDFKSSIKSLLRHSIEDSYQYQTFGHMIDQPVYAFDSQDDGNKYEIAMDSEVTDDHAMAEDLYRRQMMSKYSLSTDISTIHQSNQGATWFVPPSSSQVLSLKRFEAQSFEQLKSTQTLTLWPYSSSVTVSDQSKASQRLYFGDFAANSMDNMDLVMVDRLSVAAISKTLAVVSAIQQCYLYDLQTYDMEARYPILRPLPIHFDISRSATISCLYLVDIQLIYSEEPTVRSKGVNIDHIGRHVLYMIADSDGYIHYAVCKAVDKVWTVLQASKYHSVCHGLSQDNPDKIFSILSVSHAIYPLWRIHFHPSDSLDNNKSASIQVNPSIETAIVVASESGQIGVFQPIFTQQNASINSSISHEDDLIHIFQSVSIEFRAVGLFSSNLSADPSDSQPLDAMISLQSMAIDPLCQTLLLGYSNGVLEQWLLPGLNVHATARSPVWINRIHSKGIHSCRIWHIDYPNQMKYINNKSEEYIGSSLDEARLISNRRDLFDNFLNIGNTSSLVTCSEDRSLVLWLFHPMVYEESLSRKKSIILLNPLPCRRFLFSYKPSAGISRQSNRSNRSHGDIWDVEVILGGVVVTAAIGTHKLLFPRDLSRSIDDSNGYAIRMAPASFPDPIYPHDNPYRISHGHSSDRSRYDIHHEKWSSPSPSPRNKPITASTMAINGQSSRTKLLSIPVTIGSDVIKPFRLLDVVEIMTDSLSKDLTRSAWNPSEEKVFSWDILQQWNLKTKFPLTSPKTYHNSSYIDIFQKKSLPTAKKHDKKARISHKIAARSMATVKHINLDGSDLLETIKRIEPLHHASNGLEGEDEDEDIVRSIANGIHIALLHDQIDGMVDTMNHVSRYEPLTCYR